MGQKQLLIIDTNILSHALTANKKASFAALFTELEGQYKFVVSGFTLYEICCESSKSHRSSIVSYIQSEMSLIDLSRVLMDATARIHYLYRHHKSTKGLVIGVGDKINAALAVVANASILTIDNNDFPTPFFQETSRHRIVYTSTKKKEATETAYVLRPDMENIKECFQKFDV